MKTVTDSFLGIVPKSASEFLFQLSFVVIVPFLYTVIHVLASFQNNFKITGSFRTTIEVTGSYLKAETSFLKRVTGRILRISKWFQRSESKLDLNFLNKIGSQILRKPSARITKSTDLMF